MYLLILGFLLLLLLLLLLLRVLQQARVDKGWTQKELATKANEKPHVVNDYESGKAVPNQAIITKLERALSVKLRGSDAGKPLSKGK